jgi:hypothetical protein
VGVLPGGMARWAARIGRHPDVAQRIDRHVAARPELPSSLGATSVWAGLDCIEILIYITWPGRRQRQRWPGHRSWRKFRFAPMLPG